MKTFRKILIGIGSFTLVFVLGLYIYCNYGILEKDVRKGKYLESATEKTMNEFLPKIELAYMQQPYSKLPVNPKIFYETNDKIYWGYAYDDLLRVPVSELYFTYKDENWSQFLKDTRR